MQARGADVDLPALAGLFYPSLDSLGQFTEVAADTLPETPRRLLDHHEHMTVTVEAHHASPVEVRVLQRAISPRHYARKILLTRQSDGQVVLFGIVRLDKSAIPEAARDRIESEEAPLGRILIEHNVLREVQLVALWEILPSEELYGHFGLVRPQTLYGRTALIYCNGEPAVELLEVVTP